VGADHREQEEVAGRSEGASRVLAPELAEQGEGRGEGTLESWQEA
jgi:hypothetical protein